MSLCNWKFNPSLPALLVCISLFACKDDTREGPDGSVASESAENGLYGVADKNKPRHVLFVVIDTLRADHLSCYGYWRKTSLYIDLLAERGVKFDRAISQSSWTSPSMVALMTGRRVSRRRIQIPGGSPTLAEHFQEAGYATGAFVANQLLYAKNGFNRGFDSFTEGRLPDTDGIVEWISENKDNDTFTWVHFTDPHDPYLPRGRYKTGTPGKLTDRTTAMLKDAVETEGFKNLEEQSALMIEQIGLYDDEITWVDHKVGRLLNALSVTENLDNAIIVLTSDHGECLWERREIDGVVQHGARARGEKPRLKDRLKQGHGGFVYQEFIRVPLIINAPGLERGRIENAVAESVNVTATILDLAGIPYDQKILDGKSLFGSEILPGAYSMTNLGESFVSEEGWKLIYPTEAGAEGLSIEIQLYDLNQDPHEQNNLAGKHPEKVAELFETLVGRRETALPLVTSFDQEVEENLQALQALGYVGDIIEFDPATDEGPETDDDE